MQTTWMHDEIVRKTYFREIEFIDFHQSIWENINFWGEGFWNDARIPWKTSDRYTQVWYG